MYRGWDLFEKVRAELGNEETLYNLAKAIGDDMLYEMMDYIATCYDLYREEEDEEYEEV